MSSSIPKDYLFVDCETTIHADGNPFSRRNRLCAVGIEFNGTYYEWDIEHGGKPYAEALREIKALFDQAVCVVGFNLKFDLHWLRNYVPDIRVDRVWDCQLFEFIKSNQNAAFSSLNDAADEYLLPHKLDVVKTEYWDKGIDTLDVPRDLLFEYLRYDVELTRNVFENQYPMFTGNRRNLFLLHCLDEIVLAEIEFNGLVYDQPRSLALADEVGAKRAAVVEELNSLAPCPDINWNSADHISAVLYGGQIKYDSVETVTRQFKNHSRTYERKCVKWHECPRQIEPPDRSETKPTSEWSDGILQRTNAERLEKGEPPFYRIYSVDEQTLKGLLHHKRTRRLIRLILELANLKKLEGTYYRGVPKIMAEKCWPEGMIHGQINQCRAITGRTSSSAPNLQNFDGGLKDLFPSRFANQSRR
jgi:DNA polymerase I-like protein with 3'-5' exonuclease and polymerase domains